MAKARLFFAAAAAVFLMMCSAFDADAKRPRKRHRPASRSAATLPMSAVIGGGLPSLRVTRAVLRGSMEVDLGLMAASGVDVPFPDADSIAQATRTKDGKLVRIPEREAYIFSPNFAQLHPEGEKDAYRAALPQVWRFIDAFIIRDVYVKFGKKLQIESLVRSTKDQARLRRRNRFAAADSAHTRGGAVDIAMQLGDGTNTYLPIEMRDYIRQRLTQLELVDVDGKPVTSATPMADRQIQATEEKVCKGKGKRLCYGRAFHVVVGPKFGLRPVAYATPEVIAQR